MNYTQIKKNYDKGFWDINMVANAVVKNVITPEQFKEITGKDYSSYTK